MTTFINPDTGRWGVTFTDLSNEEIQVTMSSLATEPAVRIYVGWEWDGKDPATIVGGCAQLSVEQATIVRDALSDWLWRESQGQV